MPTKSFPRAASGKWYDLKAAATGSVTDLWIYDVIGDDWYDPSLTAKELCQRIAAIDTEEIVLHLNSPGGSVSDGMAIYNALMAHPARVRSSIEGWTCSIATVIALAADPGDVAMFDNVMFMIHNPWGIYVGNATDLREIADYLDRVAELMRSIYLARCTKTEDELRAALDAETYLTAAEAAEWGFVDEVIAGKRVAALDVSKTEALGFHNPPPASDGGATLDADTDADGGSPEASSEQPGSGDSRLYQHVHAAHYRP